MRPILAVMLKRAVHLVVLVALSLVCVSCGDDRGGAVPQVEPRPADGSMASESTPEQVGPSVDNLRTFFEAVAHPSAPNVEAARAVVAPGSIAELYLTHQAGLEQAFVDSGSPSEPDELKEVDGAFAACSATADGGCTEYGNIQAEGDKLASFTVDGNDLKGRLLAGGNKPFRVGEIAEARLMSAYISAAGDLWIVVDISNTSSSPIAIESRTSYRGADGRQSAPSGQSGPVSLLPDSRATYALMMTGGELGGALHLEMYAESGGASGAVDIPIR